MSTSVLPGSPLMAALLGQAPDLRWDFDSPEDVVSVHSGAAGARTVRLQRPLTVKSMRGELRDTGRDIRVELPERFTELLRITH